MSSAKQSDRRRSSGREAGDANSAKPGAPSLLWLVWLAPLAAGWLFVLKIHNWHLAPSALLLATGWLAVLLTGGFLLQAGLSAARGAGGEGEDFWRPEGRREELLRDKKALLKAIKEIEFDHQLGKMSDEDAKRLSGFYRARAIEIMKALDGKVAPIAGAAGDAADDLSPAERIERDVAARLAASEGDSHAEKEPGDSGEGDDKGGKGE
jgi:hypothetical protein